MKIPIRPEIRELIAIMAAIIGLMIIIGTIIVIGWWMLVQVAGWVLLIIGVGVAFPPSGHEQGGSPQHSGNEADDLPIVDNPWQI